MPDFGHIEKFFATMFQNHNFQKTSFVFESKFRSRCSTDKSVRAPFLNHCALNRDESRGHITVSIYEVHWPRADAGAHAGGGG